MTASIVDRSLFQRLRDETRPHRRDGRCVEASWLLGNGRRYLQLTGDCAAAERNYTSCSVEQNLRNHLICLELATFECKQRGAVR